jgi:hypothetical protein
MCLYITATLPPRTRPEAIRAVVERHRLSFEPINNPSVQAQLSRGEAYVRATRSYCDCGTILGSAHTIRSQLKSVSSKVERLKSRGWSDAKIERWLNQQGLACGSDDAAEPRSEVHRVSRTSDEGSVWTATLADLLSEGRCAHVGLLLHWYSQSWEREPVNIVRAEKHPLATVDEAFLRRMEEDVLYRIAAPHAMRS